MQNTQKQLTFPILKELGLTENEALIYEALLLNGAKKGQEIAEITGIGRTNVYNLITQLQTKGLILAIEGKHTHFQAIDPVELRKLLEAKRAATDALQGTFLSTLPQLTSAFNLSTGKPAVQIFEGLDGVKKTLEDSLTAKTEILTIVPPEALSEEILSIEAEYIKKRLKMGLAKRVIFPNTILAKKWIQEPDNSQTKTRLIKNFQGTFKTAIEIYDDRISLITLDENRIISVLINDRHMAELQRSMFEALWNQDHLTPPPAKPFV